MSEFSPGVLSDDDCYELVIIDEGGQQREILVGEWENWPDAMRCDPVDYNEKGVLL